jgi:serine/threonine protein kinase
MPGERSLCAKDSEATQTLIISAGIPCNDSLDAALAIQREDWLKGIRIPIADRLKACAALCADPVQAAELIYHEFILRRNAGESPDWESLLRQFPEYTEPLRRFREADKIVEDGMAPSDRTATRLGGYDLLEEIGRGGMGIVYRARERNLDRVVAIKRIREGALAAADAIRRFLKEAKAVSRLNHPNIVHIYSVGDCEGEPFIALELVEGPTLAERVGGTPLAPRLAGTIAAVVAHAIQYAHQHGIIHRDLKPANILLSGSADRPIPKVTDFGAAVDLEQAANQAGTQFLGTPSYMTPEQVGPKCGAISHLTDVYGIGALLYEALTGRPPFRADSIGETLRQVVETQPVSPRLLNPAVPRDLETICLKCLQKEPGRRFNSAAAVADDLERFLAGKPIHARPIGFASRAWMWCRRNPGSASLVAVLLVSLVGGMAGITLQWRRAEAARKNAAASDLEAQQLLSELIESNQVDGRPTFRPVASVIEILEKAETHCKNLLQRDPDETRVRIALTKVYARLNSVYWHRGQVIEAAATRQKAQALWEPLANETGSAESRYWLADVYSWAYYESVPEFFQSQQRSEALLQDLVRDQPDNLDLMKRIWRFRTVMAASFRCQFGEAWLPELKASQAELERLVGRNPGDRCLRKRLALRCFLLGEAYSQKPSSGTAFSFWRESYEHYRTLTQERPDDLLDNISLGISCSRLILKKTADPYYLQAVVILDQTCQRLKTILSQAPQCGWLRDVLLEDYCCLALCHAKAGQTAKAERAAHDCDSVLAIRLDGEQSRPEFTLEHAIKLREVGQRLREAGQPAAALRLTRAGAARFSQLAVDPSLDLNSFCALGNALTDSSTLANQLGEPALALEQAELARRILEAWARIVTDDPQREDGLAAALERIGKAHWSLGNRDRALEAFRESAAIQKRIYEREPSNYLNRRRLSQCYNRLVYYGSSAGDRRTAVDGILARTRLWPGDARQLTKSADDFAALAERVTVRAHGHLSPVDQRERDHYLSESRRLRKAAKVTADTTVRDLRVESP